VRVSVRVGPVRFYGAGAFAWWLVGAILRVVVVALWLAASHPRTSVAAIGAGALGWLLESWTVPTAFAVWMVTESVGAVLLFAPTSRAALRLLGWWRAVAVYRRHWQPACAVSGLVGDDGAVPRLGRVRCTPTHDVVRVRGLLGQRFREWEEAGPMLAHVFRAVDYRVLRGDDRRLTLELERPVRAGRSWNRDTDDR
jgi:DNA segregation ATPase FtsK/SpoIIIE, S-DNA-T family